MMKTEILYLTVAGAVQAAHGRWALRKMGIQDTVKADIRMARIKIHDRIRADMSCRFLGGIMEMNLLEVVVI